MKTHEVEVIESEILINALGEYINFHTNCINPDIARLRELYRIKDKLTVNFGYSTTVVVSKKDTGKCPISIEKLKEIETRLNSIERVRAIEQRLSKLEMEALNEKA